MNAYHRLTAMPAEAASVMPTRAINCARTEQPVAASAAPSTESEGSSTYRGSAKQAEAMSFHPRRP